MFFFFSKYFLLCHARRTVNGHVQLTQVLDPNVCLIYIYLDLRRAKGRERMQEEQKE